MKLSGAITVLLASAFVFTTTDALPTSNNGKIIVPLHTDTRFRPNPSISIRNAQARYSRFLNSPTVSNKIAVDNDQNNPKLQANKGNISLKSIKNDIQYVGKVNVGTPPQELELNFDTGSSDLWFVSTLCKNCDDYNTQFNPEKSTTFDWGTRQKWNIQYGDGSTAGGIVGYDTVDLGGFPIEHQAVELATHETQMDSVVHGILGLGFPELCTVPGTITPLENLVKQGLIKDSMFSFSLGHYLHGGGGELIFGGMNTERYVGELTSFPVANAEGYWGIRLVSATIREKLISFDEIIPKIPHINKPTITLTDRNNAKEVNALPGVLDTGTTLMIFPELIANIIAKEYNATSNDDGTYNITCDSNELSELILSFGTASYKVLPESLIYYNDNNGNCLAGFAKAKFPFVILGDVFLKNVYTVFDYSVPPTVKLAQAVSPQQYTNNNNF
ncbi:aspartic peptidase domain-containing protein [Circinella umbellata]|nr:aspartic peptidase domain-containing protein [Circinella umbellata]